MELLDQLEKVIFRAIPFLSKWQKFVRYSMVGAVATIADFSIYFSLTRSIDWFKINYLYANVCSFLVGSVVGYFLNRSWTFQQGNNFVAKQYLRFLLVNVFTLIILQFCFHLFVDILGLYDLIAKVLLLFISIVFNFTFNSFLTFKETKN